MWYYPRRNSNFLHNKKGIVKEICFIFQFLTKNLINDLLLFLFFAWLNFMYYFSRDVGGELT